MKKEAMLMKKLIETAREYLPMHKISEMEIGLPSDLDIDEKKLTELFKVVGIKLKIEKMEKLQLISVRER